MKLHMLSISRPCLSEISPRVALPISKILLTSLVLSATCLHAQTIDGFWNSSAGGNWSDTTKWTTTPAGGVPDGEGAIVSITPNFTSSGKSVVIDTTPRTVGTLAVGDNDSAFPSAFTLGASGGGTLTFNGAGSTNAQLNKSFGEVDTISAPIILASGLDITNSDDSNLVVTGTITGGFGIAVNGPGRTTFGGAVANTGFTGGVTLNSGTLAVSTSGNVLGTGALTLKGGTFRGETGSNLLTLGQTLNIEGQVTITSGTGGVTFSGPTTVVGDVTINGLSGSNGSTRNTTFSNIAGGTGNITLNTATDGTSTGKGIRIGTANHTGTLTNASTGTGWVVVSGAIGSNVTGIIQNSATASMQLRGANTYTGPTTVTAGTLEIASNGTINSSSGVTVNGGAFVYGNNTTALNRAVTVNGGQFRYNSTQAYNGALNFVSGSVGGSGNLSGTSLTIGAGRTLSPGNSPGTLNTGAETWETDGTYLWEINALATSAPPGVEGAATGWDVVVINGALSITAGTGEFDLNVDSLGVLSNWDNSGTYQWRIATATGGITGFDAGVFSINTSQFSDENSLGAGSFYVTNVGNHIFLNFSTVPEPSAVALFAIGGLAMVLRRPRGKSI